MQFTVFGSPAAVGLRTAYSARGCRSSRCRKTTSAAHSLDEAAGISPRVIALGEGVALVAA